METLTVIAALALVLIAIGVVAVRRIQHQLEAIESVRAAREPAPTVSGEVELLHEGLEIIQAKLSDLADRFDALLQAKAIDVQAYLAAKEAARETNVAHALERAKELVRNGKPIQAMKAYRDATGCELLEAKELVDSLSGKRDRDTRSI